MDDFVAYNKRFAPLVAACGFNGAIQWSSLNRGDLFLIDDPIEVPGGWVMAKDLQGNINGFGTDATSQSYKRVYLVVRGVFIFFFFNPQEDPNFVIPILDCDIVLPDRDAKIFDDRRLFKANEGYEFDIYFKQANLLRISSLTDKERKEYTQAIGSRKAGRNKKAVEEEVILSLLLGINNGQASQNDTGNIITTTRLIGQSRFDVVKAESASLQPSVVLSNGDNNQNHTPFSNTNNYNNNADNNQDLNGSGDDLLASGGNKLNASNLSVHSEITYDELEMSSRSMMEEAKARVAKTREVATMHETAVEARDREKKNPMNLSALFRMMLYFFDEPLVEDAVTSNNPIQSKINKKMVPTPHVKGQICEHMLTTVYQYYCGDDGFMAIDQLVEFMDDSGILNTHAPRDDNDEPLASYRDSLDASSLIFQVPKDLGYAKSYVQDKFGSRSLIDEDDVYSINFAQYYQTLIIITSIVYPELSEKDLTLAFNKLLNEAICPLYGWCIEDRCKRGSVDVLVQEDRIPLLLITYAPNLWRVFLMYATDVVNKPAELSLAFPEYAQVNEKVMFGLPHGFPFHSRTKAEPVYVTESALLRFCTDYALTPHILTKQELREIYLEVNRPKSVASVKLSTRDQAPTNSSLLKTTATQVKLNKSLSQSMRGRGSPTKSASMAAASIPALHLPPQPPSAVSAAGKVGGADERPRGLGFSEFVEFICKIATIGMEKDNYHALFPTPFSKVLSILTIWGIADMKKLDEVRILHNSEKIVVSA